MAKAKGRISAAESIELRASEQTEPLVLTEERQRMVAEAAYFRAERRGFNGGDPTEDWLQAEQEIARLILSARQQEPS